LKEDSENRPGSASNKIKGINVKSKNSSNAQSSPYAIAGF